MQLLPASTRGVHSRFEVWERHVQLFDAGDEAFDGAYGVRWSLRSGATGSRFVV